MDLMDLNNLEQEINDIFERQAITQQNVIKKYMKRQEAFKLWLLDVNLNH